MPELPDIDVYVEQLEKRVNGHTLNEIRISKPFLLRSVAPAITAANGAKVVQVKRIGKRIAIGLQPELWLVLHLMVAGRLRWLEAPGSISGKQQLAAFDFSSGSLLLTEAGTKKRASLYLVAGEAALAEHDPGGLEPLRCSYAAFVDRLQLENRTLKRALTNPRTLSGIGNAYSDEILHASRLSPAKLTSSLTSAELHQLYVAMQTVLREFRDRLRLDADGGFPEKVTAFRKDMAVHGKFGNPCPECCVPIARIRYKSRETNYCPRCQTAGKILADRSLSRLLKDDWPDTL